MFSIEKIKEKKKAFGYTNAQLSELSGVPLGTVQKIMSGVTASPRYETLRALSAVFDQGEDNSYSFEAKNISLVEEAQPSYNAKIFPGTEFNTHRYDRQGSYTIEDYLALPDEQRVELIDGVIYDMGAPTIPHQLISGFIYADLLSFIRTNKGNCMPFIAPTDVQLDRDNKTMVQPDVMVICDRGKINRKRIFGEPDLAIEVLSPSTWKKDFFIKGQKYLSAGVKEYWVINPDIETIIVFREEKEYAAVTHYSFNDKVPVGIFDGKCKIDFKAIKEQYKFLKDK